MSLQCPWITHDGWPWWCPGIPPMSLDHSRWLTLMSKSPQCPWITHDGRPYHRGIHHTFIDEFFSSFFFSHFPVIPWIAEASSNHQNKTKQNKKRLKKFGLYHQSRTPQCPGRLLFYRPGGYTTCIKTLIFPPKHHPVDHGICPEAYSRQKV